MIPRSIPRYTWATLPASRKRWLTARWGVYRTRDLAALLDVSLPTLMIWTHQRLGLPRLPGGRPRIHHCAERGPTSSTPGCGCARCQLVRRRNNQRYHGRATS